MMSEAISKLEEKGEHFYDPKLQLDMDYINKYRKPLK